VSTGDDDALLYRTRALARTAAPVSAVVSVAR
jgi:hypothetical protein